MYLKNHNKDSKPQILIRKIVIQRKFYDEESRDARRKIVCSDHGSLIKMILYLKNHGKDSNFNSKDRYSEKVLRIIRRIGRKIVCSDLGSLLKTILY